MLDVAKTFGASVSKYTLLVTKSTVPVGTAAKVRETVERELAARGIEVPFDVASNPEFLKEGNAIKDFMSPDRVIVGIDSERARKLMTRLYRPFLLNNFRVIFMDIPSAEMTKYAANCMLATRISLHQRHRQPVRTGRSRHPHGSQRDRQRSANRQQIPLSGLRLWGACFPKDVKALIHTAEQRGYRMQVLHAVESVNQQQKRVLFDKLMRYFGGDLTGKRIAMWGVAFKPQTDDIREAPSLVLIDLILRAGGRITVYDPVAMDECRRVVGDKVAYAKDMYEAVVDADALLLVTEWKEFRIPSWPVIERTMRCPALFDGRNIYDKHEFDGTSIVYHYIGG